MFMMVVKKLIVFPVTERGGCHGAVMGRRGDTKRGTVPELQVVPEGGL
jgi:hypothetical protein